MPSGNMQYEIWLQQKFKELTDSTVSRWEVQVVLLHMFNYKYCHKMIGVPLFSKFIICNVTNTHLLARQLKFIPLPYNLSNLIFLNNIYVK
jgi:hypothetical protein